MVALLTAQPLNRLTAQSDSHPQTIDTIIIVNGNVFDQEDAAPDWVARLANGLHMRTRQWVIRRRLLVNRGLRSAKNGFRTTPAGHAAP